MFVAYTHNPHPPSTHVLAYSINIHPFTGILVRAHAHSSFKADSVVTESDFQTNFASAVNASILFSSALTVDIAVHHPLSILSPTLPPLPAAPGAANATANASAADVRAAEAEADACDVSGVDADDSSAVIELINACFRSRLAPHLASTLSAASNASSGTDAVLDVNSSVPASGTETGNGTDAGSSNGTSASDTPTAAPSVSGSAGGSVGLDVLRMGEFLREIQLNDWVYNQPLLYLTLSFSAAVQGFTEADLSASSSLDYLTYVPFPVLSFGQLTDRVFYAWVQNQPLTREGGDEGGDEGGSEGGSDNLASLQIMVEEGSAFDPLRLQLGAWRGDMCDE